MLTLCTFCKAHIFYWPVKYVKLPLIRLHQQKLKNAKGIHSSVLIFDVVLISDSIQGVLMSVNFRMAFARHMPDTKYDIFSMFMASKKTAQVSVGFQQVKISS